MPYKTLPELRADWRRDAWSRFKSFLPMVVLGALVGAWAAAALLPELPPGVRESKALAFFNLPFLARAVLLLVYCAVMSLPLILAGLPYPTRARHELNEKIRQARAAARTGAQES